MASTLVGERLVHKNGTNRDVVMENVRVPVTKASSVPGILHYRQGQEARSGQPAAILVSGAGGGVSGPTGIWLSLATRLAHEGVPTLRLDYRQPADTPPCVEDIRAAMEELRKQFGATRFALAGWSFGSAPVFTLASQLAREKQTPTKNGQHAPKISGIAVVAPQTADAFGIRDCVPMPVLLLHGTQDRCLSPACSTSLKRAYDGAAKTREDRDRCEVMLLDGDDHCLSRHYARAETRILEFFLDAFRLSHPTPEPVESLIPSEKTGLRLMREGHDLRPGVTGERESRNEPTRRRESESEEV